ncbi:hypothetical protein B0H65DRAFT_553802 [Neurospora tetraspora]|uniref:SRR1-like domain-containing protein n=1 Tax=Neurospora tetraspora TaxID=94610 RepID=A0AAE0MJG7_9PEZI|nr:hypothetical protein B0H65DRAFT_553802 [Neurospora tetraspora]
MEKRREEKQSKSRRSKKEKVREQRHKSKTSPTPICLPDKTRLEALPESDRQRIINQWFTYFKKRQLEFLESIRRKEVRDQKIMHMVRRGKIDIDPVSGLGNFDIDTILEDEDAIDTPFTKDHESNGRSPAQEEARLAEQDSLNASDDIAHLQDAFAAVIRIWETSEDRRDFETLLDQIELLSPINKVVCLGLGSCLSSFRCCSLFRECPYDDKEFPEPCKIANLCQHAMAMTTAQYFEARGKPGAGTVEVFVSDPAYDKVESQGLESLGFTVLEAEDALAFSKIDSNTFLFDLSNIGCIRDTWATCTSPALILCNFVHSTGVEMDSSGMTRDDTKAVRVSLTKKHARNETTRSSKLVLNVIESRIDSNPQIKL